MKKLSNLEAFYQKTIHVKPFGLLSNIEIWRLEVSKEFKSYLRIKIGTQILMWGVLLYCLGLLAFAIYTNN